MKIILSFDVEGNFHKYIHSPYIWHNQQVTREGNYYSYSSSKIIAVKNFWKWKLNNSIRGYSQGISGIRNILVFLEREQVPASLGLCGYLYKNKKLPVEMPWALGVLKRDRYFWEKDNALDFSSEIRKSASKNLDFGIHGFIHEAFPLENDETMAKILEESRDSAKSLGIKPSHFVPPFNMSSNNNEQAVLKLLKKSRLVLRKVGEDNYLGKFSHIPQIKPKETKNGVKIVRLSGSFEGNSTKDKIPWISGKIISNYNKNNILCLMAHDYTFKNTAILSDLVKEIRRLSENYNLEFTTLSKA